VPAKLEPGNASYELAYSATGIVDYLAELGERAGESGSVRDKIEAAFEQITNHENEIAERLLKYLRSRTDCRIIGFEHGDDPRRVPTISFVIDDQDAGEIAKKIDAYNIARVPGYHGERRLCKSIDGALQHH